ncbi:uncharacterized protein LOC113206150 isoform X2 [Frankliniella occidentalis]|uniref:Uncharacterized protein LOC113206150 isoform X2 n=1 Tax=Frankliniella occidentalis TaxID=133901 RepID=A0A9C6X8A0_FRAOC|nr:uncharacterized protein LOC113206150 isoform X2 [Frankliniella occidentalis]
MHEVHSKYRAPKASRRTKRGSTLDAARVAKRAKEEAKKLTATAQATPVAAAPPNLPNTQGETPKTSRSAEKIARFSTSVSKTDSEYFLVDSGLLQKLIEVYQCVGCNQKAMDMCVLDRQGFAVKFLLKCTICEHVHSEMYSSHRVMDSESSRPGFQINRRMTAAFLDIGCGYTGMARFCMTIGLKVMDVTSFYGHMHKMKQETEVLKKKILEESRNAVREAHVIDNPDLKDQPVLDITVSVDGSWHRRGHISMYGFVATIDVLTGLVVDFEILSKFCLMCSIAAHRHGQDSEEFTAWKEEHLEKEECSINFNDSSGNMEAAGAVILFKRSVQEANLRYVSFLADGDAKTLSQLNKEQPYGSAVVIQKEECVNHVSKRMGTALRKLVQDEKKKGVTLGGRGEGTLTEVTMKKLQGYYHKAIVSNAPDVPKMKKAVLATLYHCTSTNQKPQHTYCPPGEESWCFYNKNKALKKRKKGDHTKMPIKINKKVFAALLPVYKRLSSDELLERCAKGQTQNANEALHSVIWKKCPKHTFVSKNRLEYGITQGVAEFNMGIVALQTMRAEIQHQSIPEAVAAKMDNKRKAQSSHQEKSGTKRHRLSKKYNKKKNNKNDPNALYGAGTGD